MHGNVGKITNGAKLSPANLFTRPFSAVYFWAMSLDTALNSGSGAFGLRCSTPSAVGRGGALNPPAPAALQQQCKAGQATGTLIHSQLIAHQKPPICAKL